MAKEDILLQEMERLEIEPMKINRSNNNENPFVKHSKRGFMKRASVVSSSCGCNIKKSVNNGICKRKNNKMLKEPVLHILKTYVDDREECQQETAATPNTNTDPLNLCTLVKTCNQLKISNGLNEQTKSKDVNDKTKWWRNEAVCSQESREQRHSNQAGSCSQQALNPQCDITIDELASYFETLIIFKRSKHSNILSPAVSAATLVENCIQNREDMSDSVEKSREVCKDNIEL